MKKFKIDLRHSMFRQKNKVAAVYCANKKEYVKLLKLLQGKITWNGSTKKLLELNIYEDNFDGIGVYIIFRPIRNGGLSPAGYEYGKYNPKIKYSLRLLFNEHSRDDYNVYKLKDFLKIFEVSA